MNIDIAKSITRNTTIQFVQQIITWGSSFLLMLFLPRYLGPVEYGRLFLALSIAGIFLVFIDYDGRTGIAKRIARNREKTGQILVDALGFRFGFWIVALLGMIAFSYIANYPSVVKVLLIIFGIEMLWLGARTVFSGIYLGHEVVQYSTLGVIAERILISVFGILALLLGAKSIGIAIIMVTATLISFFITARFIKYIVLIIPNINWKGSLTLVKEGIPFLLWTIFSVLYYQIDTIMLSLMTPEAVVGWYGASYKFFSMLAFLPSIYSITILPILSKLWGKEDQLMSRTMQRSIEFMIIAGIPISLFIFTFSKEIITLFFGLGSYTPSVLNLQIFATGILLIYIDMILGTAILASDKQRQWATAAFFAIFVNVGLNYFLIPYTQTNFGNGGIGAAIATIITEYFILIAALIILPKNMFDKSLPIVSLKAIAIGIVLAVILWIMNQYYIFWLIQILVGSIIYIGGLFILKIFNEQELTFIKSSLSLKNLKNAFTFKKGE